MFNILTNSFSKIIEKIKNKGIFTENNIKSIMRDIRISLLEADVSLHVVNEFINKTKNNIIGKKINKNFTASQEFIKILKNELTDLIGGKHSSLNLSNDNIPIAILITGLQGSGKTTTTIKLSKLLKEQYHKKVIVLSTDVYRPAAINQIENLAKIAKIDFFKSTSIDPYKIVQQAINLAKNKLYDVIVIDTAGRLHVDEKMMKEIKKIFNISKPVETLFIADCMLGQEAANIAKDFNKTIPITGTILTKVDSDARGGSALSICYATGKPIKFICTGEKINDIKPFYPDRMSSRILGMGDFFSLIEDIEQKVQNTKKISHNIKNGHFNLNDFLTHIKQMRNIGGIKNILQKLPILSNINKEKKNFFMNDKFLIVMESIINSMTKKERLKPKIIKSSNKKRIALGSGTSIQDINKLLKQFDNMYYMIKKIKKSGIKKTINNLKNIIHNMR